MSLSLETLTSSSFISMIVLCPQNQLRNDQDSNYDEIWLQQHYSRRRRRIETLDQCQCWDPGDRRISHHEEAPGSCFLGIADYGFHDGPSYEYAAFRSPNEPGIHHHATCGFEGRCKYMYTSTCPSMDIITSNEGRKC